MIWNFNKYGNKIALISNDQSITYTKLGEYSEYFLRNFSSRSLVFLLCSNTIESVTGYVGCLNHGMVPVMIDSNLDDELLLGLADKYHPQYYWLPSNRKETCAEGRDVYTFGDYTLVEVEEKMPCHLHDDLALLMTTSGSTGSPKLVRLSRKNVIANTESIIDYLKIDEGERSVTNLPMHYVYGLSIINTHLYAGASLVMTEKSMFHKDFWQMMKSQEVTSFGGVPYTFAMLNRLHFERMDLPKLRTITQAGGKLPRELHEKFALYAQESGKNFVVMYGAAEATARMGYLPSVRSLEKCGSMGIPIPGGRFVLLDEDGKEISVPHTVGELVYYGDNVMMGYAENGADLVKGDEMQGCLRTGDLAKFDEEGYYFIVGRKKRFLKIFGKRINLEEIEHILKQHYGLMEVACTGKDDELHIFTSAMEIAEGMKEYISIKFNIHPSALIVHIIEEIPKNASGKTLYASLEKFYC